MIEAPLTQKEKKLLRENLRISKQPFTPKYPKDIVGFRFGKLVILGEITPKLYSCLCDCGTRTQVSKAKLISGTIQSCGCSSKI